jgi:hypothetical protein
LEATQCQVVAGDVSVCLYDEPLRNAYNLCRPLFTSLLEAVAACYATSPDPGALGSLAQGDCDGDGLANAQDLVDPCTRPFVPPDDAGVVLRDLGVDDDAAIIAPPFDQGATDAGGSSAAPGVGFQGGGGCHALAQGPSGSRAAGFALLVSLAGLIARRRQG